MCLCTTQSTQPGGDGHPQLPVYLIVHAPPHARESFVRYHESGHRAHARAHVLAIRGAYQPCYFGVASDGASPPSNWGYRQARPCPAASDRHGAQRHFGVASDGAPPPSLGLQTGVTCPASSDRHGARSPTAPPLDQGREFVQSIAPPIGLQAGVTIFCPGSSVRLSASQGLEVPGVRL